MTDDVKERVARALAGDDPDRITYWNNGECWEPYGAAWERMLSDVQIALSALLPGDEINGCVLVPKIDILDAIRVDGATERDCEMFSWVEDALYRMRDALRSTRVGGVCGQTVDACFKAEMAREIAAYRAMLAKAKETNE